MRFKDLTLGFADARREYLNLKGLFFQKTFFDDRNVVPALLDDYFFIVCGSKGVGKTAVISKLRSLGEDNPSLIVDAKDLSNFEYATFAKTKSDSETTGTQKYKQSWDFLIYTSLLQLLVSSTETSDLPQEFEKVAKFLSKIGVDIQGSTSRTINRNSLSLKNIKLGAASLVSLDIELEKESGLTPYNYVDRISIINQILFDCISNFNLSDTKFFLTIDGLDDVLRLKKNQTEIIASLIRSAASINDLFIEANQQIKVILSAREDLMGTINDPDLNKICQDGQLKINWSNDTSGLKEILARRFAYSGYSGSNSFDLWYQFFPKYFARKDSWDYLVERTLRKPRDVIQFMETCKRLYPDKCSLDRQQFKLAIKTYSSEYLIKEMENELSGFIEQKFITSIPTVFQSLGSNEFSNVTFHRIFSDMSIQGYTESITNKILLLLYERGYIGQIITSGGKHGRSYTNVIFKNRNPDNPINYNKHFIIHKGILQGLGIHFD